MAISDGTSLISHIHRFFKARDAFDHILSIGFLMLSCVVNVSLTHRGRLAQKILRAQVSRCVCSLTLYMIEHL